MVSCTLGGETACIFDVFVRRPAKSPFDLFEESTSGGVHEIRFLLDFCANTIHRFCDLVR